MEKAHQLYSNPSFFHPSLPLYLLQSPFLLHKLLDSMWGSGCVIVILSDPVDGLFPSVL